MAALYVPLAIQPAILETLIITPLFRAFMMGNMACIKRIGAVTKTSSRAISSEISLTKKLFFIPKPALLINTSTGLEVFCRRSSTRLISSSRLRSATKTSTSTPKFSLHLIAF